MYLSWYDKELIKFLNIYKDNTLEKNPLYYFKELYNYLNEEIKNYDLNYNIKNELYKSLSFKIDIYIPDKYNVLYSFLKDMILRNEILSYVELEYTNVELEDLSFLYQNWDENTKNLYIRFAKECTIDEDMYQKFITNMSIDEYNEIFDSNNLPVVNLAMNPLLVNFMLSTNILSKSSRDKNISSKLLKYQKGDVVIFSKLIDDIVIVKRKSFKDGIAFKNTARDKENFYITLYDSSSDIPGLDEEYRYAIIYDNLNKIKEKI